MNLSVEQIAEIIWQAESWRDKSHLINWSEVSTKDVELYKYIANCIKTADEAQK